VLSRFQLDFLNPHGRITIKRVVDEGLRNAFTLHLFRDLKKAQRYNGRPSWQDRSKTAIILCSNGEWH
jgi:hypothetical protein